MKSNDLLRVSMKGWTSKHRDRWSFTGDDTAEDLFDDELLSEFRDTYNALPRSVMKADMWRLAKVYKDGGWWVDADTTPIHDIPTPPNLDEMYVMAENDTHMCNMMFYAPREYWVLRLGLYMIRDRMFGMRGVHLKQYRQRLGDSYIHLLTGPGLFTDMLHAAVKIHDPSVNLSQSKTKWTDVPGVFRMYVPDENNDEKVRTKTEDYFLKHNVQPSHGVFVLFGSVAHLFGGQEEDGWTNE